MTCDDARELFSALVDEALSPEECAALDAHLAGCADCRRELDGFRRTIALVHAAPPVRAPAGFVDRVLAAARPRPWYQRLTRRLFVPLPVKLPLEAAAIVLVSILVVQLYRQTPELQQASRPEPPSVVSEAPRPRLTPSSPTTQSAEPVTPSRPSVLRQSAPASAPPPAEPRAENRREMAERREREQAAPKPPAAVTETVQKSEKSVDALGDAARAPAPAEAARESLSDRSSSSAVEQPPAAGEQRAAEETRTKSDPAPAEVPVTRESPSGRLSSSAVPQQSPAAGEQRALEEKKAKSAAAPPPAAAPRMAALRSADVAGRLTVLDRAAAERAVSEIVVRLGGTVLARRADSEATVVDLQVPRSAYPALLEGLTAIGRFTVEQAVSDLPDHVHLSLRVSG